MNKLIAKKSAAMISKMLGLVAVLFVSTACVFWVHRPTAPAELLSKK